jgi:hypothetical protein
MRVEFLLKQPNYILMDYKAASASSFNFQSSETSGVKVASRDIPGNTSTLAIVAKAGSRYEWVPGLSEGLEKFAFRVCRLFGRFESIELILYRIPKSDLPFVSFASLSCWDRNFSPTEQGKLSSTARSS